MELLEPVENEGKGSTPSRPEKLKNQKRKRKQTKTNETENTSHQKPFNYSVVETNNSNSSKKPLKQLLEPNIGPLAVEEEASTYSSQKPLKSIETNEKDFTPSRSEKLKKQKRKRKLSKKNETENTFHHGPFNDLVVETNNSDSTNKQLKQLQEPNTAPLVLEHEASTCSEAQRMESNLYTVRINDLKEFIEKALHILCPGNFEGKNDLSEVQKKKSTVSSLGGNKLKALLEDSMSYKNPRDIEEKSDLFKSQHNISDFINKSNRGFKILQDTEVNKISKNEIATISQSVTPALSWDSFIKRKGQESIILSHQIEGHRSDICHDIDALVEYIESPQIKDSKNCQLRNTLSILKHSHSKKKVSKAVSKSSKVPPKKSLITKNESKSEKFSSLEIPFSNYEEKIPIFGDRNGIQIISDKDISKYNLDIISNEKMICALEVSPISEKIGCDSKADFHTVVKKNKKTKTRNTSETATSLLGVTPLIEKFVPVTGSLPKTEKKKLEKNKISQNRFSQKLGDPNTDILPALNKLINNNETSEIILNNDTYISKNCLTGSTNEIITSRVGVIPLIEKIVIPGNISSQKIDEPDNALFSMVKNKESDNEVPKNLLKNDREMPEIGITKANNEISNSKADTVDNEDVNHLIVFFPEIKESSEETKVSKKIFLNKKKIMSGNNISEKMENVCIENSQKVKSVFPSEDFLCKESKPFISLDKKAGESSLVHSTHSFPVFSYKGDKNTCESYCTEFILQKSDANATKCESGQLETDPSSNLTNVANPTVMCRLPVIKENRNVLIDLLEDFPPFPLPVVNEDTDKYVSSNDIEEAMLIESPSSDISLAGRKIVTMNYDLPSKQPSVIFINNNSNDNDKVDDLVFGFEINEELLIKPIKSGNGTNLQLPFMDKPTENHLEIVQYIGLVWEFIKTAYDTGCPNVIYFKP